MKYRLQGMLFVILAATALTSCVPSPALDEPLRRSRREPVSAADGWRYHRLSRCQEIDLQRPGATDEDVLRMAWELFSYGEGGDAIIELEIRLQESVIHDGLLLLTLAQLYVLAGQGEPTLVPVEGPAADTGSWDRNKSRFLSRAKQILEEARSIRPDDSCVEFLYADAVRAEGDLESAAKYSEAGLGKCSLLSSLEVIRKHQDLTPAAALQVSMDTPSYPSSAGSFRKGEVVLDVLVSPYGSVTQVEKVSSPDARLVGSATEAARSAVFKPGRMGKYPVWTWARIGIMYK